MTRGHLTCITAHLLIHMYIIQHVCTRSCGQTLDELSCCLIVPVWYPPVDKLSLLTLTEFALWYLKCLLAVLSHIDGDLLESVEVCLCLFINAACYKYGGTHMYKYDLCLLLAVTLLL